MRGGGSWAAQHGKQAQYSTIRPYSTSKTIHMNYTRLPWFALEHLRQRKREELAVPTVARLLHHDARGAQDGTAADEEQESL